MRKLVTIVAIAGVALMLEACPKKADTNAADAANAAVENAADASNAADAANAAAANATAAANAVTDNNAAAADNNAATNNATDQGSTDH